MPCRAGPCLACQTLPSQTLPSQALPCHALPCLPSHFKNARWVLTSLDPIDTNEK
jgi:hypothetical protein